MRLLAILMAMVLCVLGTTAEAHAAAKKKTPATPPSGDSAGEEKVDFAALNAAASAQLGKSKTPRVELAEFAGKPLAEFTAEIEFCGKKGENSWMVKRENKQMLMVRLNPDIVCKRGDVLAVNGTIAKAEAFRAGKRSLQTVFIDLADAKVVKDKEKSKSKKTLLSTKEVIAFADLYRDAPQELRPALPVPTSRNYTVVEKKVDKKHGTRVYFYERVETWKFTIEVSTAKDLNSGDVVSIGEKSTGNEITGLKVVVEKDDSSNSGEVILQLQVPAKDIKITNKRPERTTLQDDLDRISGKKKKKNKK